MRKVFILTLLALLVFALAAPAFADEGAGSAAPTQEQVSPGGGSGKIGGIEPVSPEQFAGKVQELGEKLYGAASPLADMVAKLSLAAAGLLLVLLIVLGAGILRRVVGAAFAVAVGLALWYGAPYVIGIIKYLAAWLTS
ncbi:MAG: hypothetical protein QHH75_10685 [Bacillota bacterium]|nr:hypothetical protein [Bacillota bacterium]